MTTSTQVGIVGAGPAGLVLAHLLHGAGIDSVVVESRSREYVQERVRAGVLEQGTVELLAAIGAGERLGREGLPHHGFDIRFEGRSHRIDLRALTGGRCITVYGQNEVLKDLIDLRLQREGPLVFDAADVAVEGIDGTSPSLRYVRDGIGHEIACEFVAGCDGFHGICRSMIPAAAATVYDREYPFGWLGILADAPPSSAELIYARHDRGFALHSMRSPTVTRLYLQCRPDEPLDAWSDDRIWDELETRLAAPGFRLNRGAILQRGVTGMRSFVIEPMQHGRLFLAGDAAHIVPPTGAKGLNLAVADVWVLARALTTFYRTGATEALAAYSATCLRRVWRAQQFSAWMTRLLHRPPEEDGFERRRQLAELDLVTSSAAAATLLAEQYVGVPLS